MERAGVFCGMSGEESGPNRTSCDPAMRQHKTCASCFVTVGGSDEFRAEVVATNNGSRPVIHRLL